ncbi:MAG: squalene synthase HpnD [Dehalococcoidia bacterium]|nr:squalene synthase HpnD [Dehalococcoidia bacterium]
MYAAGSGAVGADAAALQAAYRHCRQIARTQARNFYFAFLPLPQRQRQAIYAVYAFSRACDDYADEPIPLEQKQALLDQQRRRLHDCYAGNPEGPVFTALADVVRTYRIPRQHFDDLLDGVVMDLTVRRYQTFDSLRDYCYHVASVVGLICLEIFGYTDPKAKEYAVDLGIAMQLVNIMRDVKEDIERDRVYLPLDELARFEYYEDDLRYGVMDERFLPLMRFQAARARGYFASGAKLLPLVPRRTRVCPATLQGLYSSLLTRMEQQGYNVHQERVRLSTSKKLYLVGTIWLKTKLGKA